jgi:hypothetical protein
MADVYKAFDTRLKREVALKLIRKDAFPREQFDHFRNPHNLVFQIIQLIRTIFARLSVLMQNAQFLLYWY